MPDLCPKSADLGVEVSAPSCPLTMPLYLGLPAEQAENQGETIYHRLGLEHTCWDSNPAKTHSLVLGSNGAQVLDVLLQKEFGERQSDR